jgi:hypothetical protein
VARRDLSNAEIERMGREKPGSAAEYLRLRREELAAERQQRREQDDYARFEQEFVRAGGTKSAAREAYTRRRNEAAEKAAVAADEAAVQATRTRIRGRL